MPGDRAIRATTALVVDAVAGFAAVVSYSHIYDLGVAHGQAGTAARLLPLSVDLLIVAASLVMLHEARAGRRAPALSRLMLWLGIGATVGANIAFGARFGPLGMVISAWPAVAFVGAAELGIGLARRARPGPGSRMASPDSVAVAPGLVKVPADAQSAALAALAASVAAGNPISGRQLEKRFGLTRAQATKVRQAVLAGANGHDPA